MLKEEILKKILKYANSSTIIRTKLIKSKIKLDEIIEKKYKISKNENFNRIKDRRRAVIKCIKKESYMVYYYVRLGITDYQKMMNEGCLNNKIRIIELMILKGADNYNVAMANAAKNNHKELLEYLILKGANDYNQA